MHSANNHSYLCYDITAQVLQVGDDAAVCLDVGMLDELGEALLPDA